jgi:hypothetical protein
METERIVKSWGIYFNVGGELNVHYTSYEPRYERIRFDDLNVLVLRYQRRGEMTWTIMPITNIAYITED